MPTIIDRRSVYFAVSISYIQQVGPSNTTTRITPVSRERQYADVYQSV